MMNTIVRLTFVSMVTLAFMLMFVAVPAYSAEVIQIFHCQQDEDATEKDVVAAASEWLNAAKKMKGGDQLQASVHFPVVAHMGEHDFLFVIKAPSMEKWGMFMDGYNGSPAQEVDKKKFDNICDCPDSSLWEPIMIK
ncbi:MAG: hypothetical protein HN366_00465 [Deltaproteobacteria bacterium]|mgnify:FL=1|jgi:hypothetical protein|nr:hypothetical protein [Deltaproteobacteria bacterium]